MNQLNLLKNKFLALENREQKALIAGIVVVVFFVLNTVIYEPMKSSITQLQISNTENSALLLWMTESANQIKNSPGSANSNTPRGNGSLNEMINTTAAKASIIISRSRPRNNNQYQIWLDEVAFNQLLNWLNTLQNEAGIYVTSINLATSDKKGIVRANLTFQGFGNE